LFFNHCLSCGKSRDWDSERRAAHVCEADAMAELNAVGIASMLAADAELDVGTCLLPLCNGYFHQLANARLIHRGKWVFLDDFEFLIRSEERARVIAAHAKRGLREVVRAEAEELGGLRDFIRCEWPARDFNHRADEIVQFCILFLHHFLCDPVNNFDLKIELFLKANQRNHDLRIYFNSCFLHFSRCFEDRARLHLGDFGVDDAKTAAAEAEHWVKFM